MAIDTNIVRMEDAVSITAGGPSMDIVAARKFAQDGYQVATLSLSVKG